MTGRSTRRPFLVCLHDATPAFARETRMIVRDLAPLLGRRLSCGVVPDWHGAWPLAAHPEYGRLLRDASEDLLLHGCLHQRRRGRGPISWLTENADEMNGLDRDATRRTLERGQQIFADRFGEPARGFLAPAWQQGQLRLGDAGLQHVLGFFSLETRSGCRVPLATWSWDCGRWRWLGHVGQTLGGLAQGLGRGVPVLAIHPRDLHRGFWPTILRLTQDLLSDGYEPFTVAGLLDAHVETAA